MSYKEFTAQYDLVDWLGSHPDIEDHVGTPEETADAILSRHAHELAEKIRECPKPSYLGRDDRAMWDMVRRHVANIIDPKVEK